MVLNEKLFVKVPFEYFSKPMWCRSVISKIIWLLSISSRGRGLREGCQAREGEYNIYTAGEVRETNTAAGSSQKKCSGITMMAKGG